VIGQLQFRRPIALLALGAFVIGLSVSAAGCATRTKTGAVIGAGTGGAIGAIIGKQTGNTAVGAIIGAAVGGAAGAYIGRYMDRQAEEIQRDLQGAKVERVGEGIKITFDSGILFDSNKADLKEPARANLDQLAVILEKYQDTNILIEGHTDSQGTDEHNLSLSRSRSQSVANYLAGQQVDATRFTTMGYGESQPIADNELAEGRAQNRRVELAIMANDKLKKEAEKMAG
jgi:outer membrane protein OmpA-like peptidoglycan-associated protein